MLLMRKEECKWKGNILFEKYRMIEELGTGLSGIVYKAEHIRLQELRAIKCIDKTRPFYEQLSKEAVILKNLKHSAIPLMYDIEEDESYLYLIEEYIAGESLQDIVNNQEKFPVMKVMEYGIQLCRVIHYLHTCYEAPVLYLDLKPSNILIAEDQLKLIDFGTCRKQGEQETIQLSMGTLGYAAPEQYTGVSGSEKTDVYGIGAVLYYMLTGQRVDGGYGHVLRQLKISTGLKKVVADCLEPDIRKRPKEVKEVEERLMHFSTNRRIGRLTTDSVKKNHQKSSGGSKMGIIGAGRGAGVTYYALQQGMMQKRSGQKIALAELNSHNDFGKLKLNDNRNNNNQKIFCQSNHQRIFSAGEGMSVFSLNGIDYYPGCNAGTMLMLQNMNYDNIIVDFGCCWEESRDEFLRCQEKHVMLNADIWHMEETIQLLEQISKEQGSRKWNYLSVFYEDRNLRQLEAAYGITIQTLLFGNETVHRRRWRKKFHNY